MRSIPHKPEIRGHFVALRHYVLTLARRARRCASCAVAVADRRLSHTGGRGSCRTKKSSVHRGSAGASPSRRRRRDGSNRRANPTGASLQASNLITTGPRRVRV